MRSKERCHSGHTNKKLFVDPDNSPAYIVDAGGVEGDYEHQTRAKPGDVLEAHEEGREPEAVPEDMYTIASVTDALYESKETGEPVETGEDIREVLE